MYSGLFHIIRLQADARVTNEVIVNECMEMGVTCAIDARYIHIIQASQADAAGPSVNVSVTSM